MLSGLSDLLQRMANAVDDERREAFLYQIHSLLHKHHLHDHPFMEEFEHDLARSIATGNRFEAKDIRLPAPYKNNTPFQSSSPLMNSEYEVARHEALQERNLDETKRARGVALEMKGYGQELVDKASEMKGRAELMERQQNVPSLNQEEIIQRLKHSMY
jgi:hypothetical protein